MLLSLTLEAASFACSVFSLAIFVNCCAATKASQTPLGGVFIGIHSESEVSYVHLQQICAAYISGMLCQARPDSMHTALYEA